MQEIDMPGNDFIVSELLSEMKEENNRKSHQIKLLIKVIVTLIVVFTMATGSVIAGFLWYLNQYDFTSQQTISGTYAIVDSDGNVIAQDITPEEYEAFKEATE